MDKQTILLVDDDRLVLATLAKGLERAGYSVIKAESSSEALSVCTGQRPDLGIYDTKIPDPSESSVVDELRKRYDIPFIVLSACGDPNTVCDAANNGAFCYLVKPLDVSQLIPCIESALCRARELRKLQESEANLTESLNTNRAISTAIGILMERYRLTNQMAVEMLHSQAHALGKNLIEIADRLLNETETRNKSFL